MTPTPLAELLDIAERATGVCRVDWSPEDAIYVAKRLIHFEDGEHLRATAVEDQCAGLELRIRRAITVLEQGAYSSRAIAILEGRELL